MEIDLKKFYYKLFDRKKYKLLKSFRELKDKGIEESRKVFKEKYENYIYEIQKKLKNNQSLNFIHSGHSGDVVYSLPVIKELSKNHECNLFIQVNKKMPLAYYKHPAGKVYINDKILSLLLPLLKSQKFLKKADKYNGEKIDINLDLFRELPVNMHYNIPRWFFHIVGIQVDLANPYLDIGEHEKLKNKIIIHRTFRYRNQFINYKFLKNYSEIYFIGLDFEFDDLKKDIPNLQMYECKDYLDMAKIIKSSKFFIGNQSIAYSIAEALKVPRILEGCPYFPVVQPIGKDSFDFYYQPHFEKWCKYLNEKY